MNRKEMFKENLKIGLEIHCQLTNLNTKLFCNCLSNYRTSLPNDNTCPICLGLPGTLPLLNKRAVDFASMVCIALNCKIPEKISFYRKNYFYPDLPKNFQITQYNSYEISSIGYEGHFSIDDDSGAFTQMANSKPFKSQIRISRIQLEEDPGKIVYEDEKTSANTYSLIDYNRAGVALIEIVTEPDFSSSHDVRIFLNDLINIFEYLGVCDPSLEGSIRCDVNVSLRGGKKVEIKNISSFKDVEKSINYEVTRQRTMIMHDMEVQAETRHWDEKRKITISSRSKEEEEEYRYFPEPDIPVILLGGQSFVSSIRSQMNELPNERLQRYKEQMGLSTHTANILANSKKISDYFEESLKHYNSPIEISNWIVNELLSKINEMEKSDASKGVVIDLAAKMSPAMIANMAKLVSEKGLNRNMAREIFAKSFQSGEDPYYIVKSMNVEKISDSEEILSLITETLEIQPTLIDQSKTNPNVVNFILGLIMKKTRGRTNPQLAIKLIQDVLSSKKN
ncbi:MAG: Asp-tRNA(Asn)/Glu-tRNA(Gln) amidotransferase subunit GatB [Candidatus Nitrosocosmicus sp.]